MNARANQDGDVRPRTAAFVAGIALLLMAVIAPLASFGVVGNLSISGDAAATAANLAQSAGAVRLAATGLMVVVILDIIVAWSLFVVLRDKNHSLSLLGAWFRLVYAATFPIAIANLFRAALTAGSSPEQAVLFLDSFNLMWQVSLFVFSFHLLTVGVLVWRPGVVEKVLGALLLLAGAGYLIDGLGAMIDPSYDLGISAFTFTGEVLFIIWLFARGGKNRPAMTAE